MTTRKYHKLIGIAVSVFVFILSITGIALHYIDPIVDAVTTSDKGFPAAPTVMAETESMLWVGTKKGVFQSTKSQPNWYRTSIRYPHTEVSDIETLGSQIWVVFKDGALFYTTQGQVWNRLNTPPATTLSDLSLSSDMTLNIITDNGVYSSTDSGQTWLLTHPVSQAAVIRHWILALHTGYPWQPMLPLLYNLATIGLIGLIITGFIIVCRR